MARIILITGGCRSGKSAFALEQANSHSGEKYFLATSPKLDEEMRERISRHQKEREGFGWITKEEETELISAVRELSPREHSLLVLDCLSLWINNLLFQAETRGETLDQDSVRSLCFDLGGEIQACPFQTVFLVTSEVGLGLVPENRQGRLYRDLLGICNQTFAGIASEVYLLISGIPVRIKNSSERISL